MSTLHDIYNKQYTPDKSLSKMPFTLRLKERAFLDAVETEMGADFLERHQEGLRKVEEFKGFANFREGFRLGVSLMLELL